MNKNESSRPVLITLSGGSKNELNEEEEPIKLLTHGQLTDIGEGYILRYEETQTDENDGSVMTQEVMLTMQPHQVIMNRCGDYGTSMVFAKDRRFEGAYHTPFGSLDIALYTTRMDMTLNPEQGSLYLEYQLDFQGGYASMHTMQVCYVASDPPC